MKINNFAAAACSVAMLAMAGASVAQQNVRFSYDGRPERLFRPVNGLNRHDMMGVRDAAISNLLEIKTSELALNRARSAWARQYAREMIQEHTVAHNELKLIANRKGVSLPQTLPAAKRAQLARLSNLSGSAFDREYRAIQISGHRETSAKFQAHIKGGRDQDVKSYLVKSLPAVKMHLRMAQMQRTMTGPTKMEHNG